MTPKQVSHRKMVEIDVDETSGVDHPAHLHEGWVVRKAVDAEAVSKLFGLPDTTKEEATVADNETPEELEKARKAELDALQEKYDKLEAEHKELKRSLKKEAESPEEVAKAALPEEVRKQLDDQAAELQKARDEIQKERDARLDEQAIVKSREVFTHLGFDHGVVAPALRKMAVIDADLAEAVSVTLKAAEAQLESAGLFAELGKSTSDEDTVSELDRVVKAVQDAEPTLTKEQAIAKAYETNPELYTIEKAGK